MEKLQPNHCYHIFNHANGFENIFKEEENYRYFLEKYQLYISPIAETYAYCLMPNHFHLVVRIRRKEIIESLFRTNKSSNNLSNNLSKFSSNFGQVNQVEEIKLENNEIEKYISKQFSNLFSCYTQSFNKMYKRRGSLFIKNFKRELILDRDYFLNAIVYTHRNPIHHRFCAQFTDWNYSSYSEIKEQKSTIIELSKLLKVFDNNQNFIDFHQRHLNKFNQLTELETPV